MNDLMEMLGTWTIFLVVVVVFIVGVAGVRWIANRPPVATIPPGTSAHGPPHPSSDKEINIEHALCFIAHLQGLAPSDKHCRLHGIDYDENGSFWAE